MPLDRWSLSSGSVSDNVELLVDSEVKLSAVLPPLSSGLRLLFDRKSCYKEIKKIYMKNLYIR